MRPSIDMSTVLRRILGTACLVVGLALTVLQPLEAQQLQLTSFSATQSADKKAVVATFTIRNTGSTAFQAGVGGQAPIWWDFYDPLSHSAPRGYLSQLNAGQSATASASFTFKPTVAYSGGSYTCSLIVSYKAGLYPYQLGPYTTSVALAPYVPQPNLRFVGWNKPLPLSAYKDDPVRLSAKVQNTGDGPTAAFTAEVRCGQSICVKASLQQAPILAGSTRDIDVVNDTYKVAATYEARLIIAAYGITQSAAIVISERRPDLTMPANCFTLSPPDPVSDAPVSITLAVKNAGGAPAGAFKVAVYLDTAGTPTLLNVPAGVGVGQSVGVTVLQAQLAEGPHALRVVVNPSGTGATIAEADTSNNERTLPFSVRARLPDLAVISVTWAPDAPSTRDNTTIYGRFRNAGTARSLASSWWLYDSVSTRGGTLPPIEPGAETYMPLVRDEPLTAGNHALRLTVTADSRETNLNNNQATASLYVKDDTLPADITPAHDAPSACTKVTLRLGDTYSGAVNPANMVDYFCVDVPLGIPFTATIDPATCVADGQADKELTLCNANGTVLRRLSCVGSSLAFDWHALSIAPYTRTHAQETLILQVGSQLTEGFAGTGTQGRSQRAFRYKLRLYADDRSGGVTRNCSFSPGLLRPEDRVLTTGVTGTCVLNSPYDVDWLWFPTTPGGAYAVRVSAPNNSQPVVCVGDGRSDLRSPLTGIPVSITETSYSFNASSTQRYGCVSLEASGITASMTVRVTGPTPSNPPLDRALVTPRVDAAAGGDRLVRFRIYLPPDAPNPCSCVIASQNDTVLIPNLWTEPSYPPGEVLTVGLTDDDLKVSRPYVVVRDEQGVDVWYLANQYGTCTIALPDYSAPPSAPVFFTKTLTPDAAWAEFIEGCAQLVSAMQFARDTETPPVAAKNKSTPGWARTKGGGGGVDTGEPTTEDQKAAAETQLKAEEDPPPPNRKGVEYQTREIEHRNLVVRVAATTFTTASSPASNTSAQCLAELTRGFAEALWADKALLAARFIPGVGQALVAYNLFQALNFLTHAAPILRGMTTARIGDFFASALGFKDKMSREAFKAYLAKHGCLIAGQLIEGLVVARVGSAANAKLADIKSAALDAPVNDIVSTSTAIQRGYARVIENLIQGHLAAFLPQGLHEKYRAAANIYLDKVGAYKTLFVDRVQSSKGVAVFLMRAKMKAVERLTHLKVKMEKICGGSQQAAAQRLQSIFEDLLLLEDRAMALERAGRAAEAVQLRGGIRRFIGQLGQGGPYGEANLRSAEAALRYLRTEAATNVVRELDYARHSVFGFVRRVDAVIDEYVGGRLTTFLVEFKPWRDLSHLQRDCKEWYKDVAVQYELLTRESSAFMSTARWVFPSELDTPQNRTLLFRKLVSEIEPGSLSTLLPIPFDNAKEAVYLLKARFRTEDELFSSGAVQFSTRLVAR